jgi:hypothetical protein
MGVIMTWIMFWLMVCMYMISCAYDFDPAFSVTLVMSLSMIITFFISIAVGWIRIK